MAKSLPRVPVALLCLSAALVSTGAHSFVVTATSTSNWTIDGQPDPALTLNRGQSYTFDLQGVNPIHPFFIKTVDSTGSGNQFTDGVTNNGASGDTDVTFVVPANAPAQLFYNCGTHGAMAGALNIVDPPPLFRDGFE